jgi:hypothetical protein
VFLVLINEYVTTVREVGGALSAALSRVCFSHRCAATSDHHTLSPHCPGAQVAETTKGFDLGSLYCMIKNCGDK